MKIIIKIIDQIHFGYNNSKKIIVKNALKTAKIAFVPDTSRL